MRVEVYLEMGQRGFFFRALCLKGPIFLVFLGTIGMARNAFRCTIWARLSVCKFNLSGLLLLRNIKLLVSGALRYMLYLNCGEKQKIDGLKVSRVLLYLKQNEFCDTKCEQTQRKRRCTFSTRACLRLQRRVAFLSCVVAGLKPKYNRDTIVSQFFRYLWRRLVT